MMDVNRGLVRRSCKGCRRAGWAGKHGGELCGKSSRTGGTGRREGREGMLGGGKKDRWVWEVGNEGTRVHGGEDLTEVVGIWGCLDKSVGAGLDGRRDGGECGRQITATNFLAHPLSSLCGQLTCHTWVDVQRH